MSEMNNIKDYLISLGASKVGFADVNGLASEFIDLPNAISIVMKIPKETIQLVKDENYEVFTAFLKGSTYLFSPSVAIPTISTPR